MADPNVDIVIDCADPETLAEFWADALVYTKVGVFENYNVLLAPTREHPPVLLQRVAEPKSGKAHIHFDLGVDDIEAEAQRLEALGASRIDIGQGTDPGLDHHGRPRGQRVLRVSRHSTPDETTAVVVRSQR
jgi:hypothetical protein